MEGVVNLLTKNLLVKHLNRLIYEIFCGAGAVILGVGVDDLVSVVVFLSIVWVLFFKNGFEIF